MFLYFLCIKNTFRIHFPSFLLLLFSLIFTLQVTAQTEQLTTYLSDLPTSIRVSVQAEKLDNTFTFNHRADQQVPAASIIKVPILITLLQQAEAEQLHLKGKYRLQAGDKVGGAGTLQQAADGERISYYDLAIKMIVESDNTATNILIRKVGMENVNTFLAAQNLPNTSLQRLMMDFEAIAQGQQNYTSATEMNKLLSRLAQGKLLSKKMTRKAIKILLQCEDETTIPSQLPDSLKIAHKTGTLDYVRGDAALIFMKKNTLVLSIFVEGFSFFEEAERVIGEVAKLVYEEVKQ